MTSLNKPVVRTSKAFRHEKSKTRAYILSLEPPSKIGVRLAGTRDCFRLDAVAVYELAVQGHQKTIEREAKRIAKTEGISLKVARTKAKQGCKGLLR